MSSLLGYFSFDRKKTAGSAPIREKPVRALPASWYTAPEVFELECRAIFSSRWLLLTSKLLVKAPGECLRYQFAGFDVIVTCDQEHDINVFHNKSRQSGQLIFDDGASGIGENFRCKNGWTYALNGILLEAPEYPELKSGNATHRLDRIHTKIDRNGFLWISLDTEAIPRITWEEHFKDVDVQARYKDSEFNDYVLDHTYQLECEYNWKVAADNFNEFYHCPTTHSDIPAFLNLKSFDSALAGGHTQHACQPTQEPFDAGVNVHSTYYFPNVSMTAGKHFLMIQKFLPHSPTKSTIVYGIFKNKNSTDEEFHLIADMYERVMREDKVLCNNAQANLNRGVFNNGLLHPRYEKAPLFFQQKVREAVTAHGKREKTEGREIWPASYEEVTKNEEQVDRNDVTDISRGTQKVLLA